MIKCVPKERTRLCGLAPIIVLAGLSILVSAMTLASCSSPAPLAVPPLTHTVSIEAPSAVLAGAEVPITVRVEPQQDDIYVDIVALGSFGVAPQRFKTNKVIARGQLQPSVTRFAGSVTLRAQVGQISAERELVIRPGEAVDPIGSLVGPRSIVADGNDWTMLVATPRDRFDNPVRDGTELSIAVQHPGANAPRSVATEVKHLLGWKRITSQTQAGKTFLAVRSGAAYGPERMILEVPGAPTPFELRSEQAIYQADGRRLVRINSDVIKDAFGNTLLDGTAALLLVKIDGELSRSIPAYLVDGRIFATLQAPDFATAMVVQASIGTTESEPLQIVFEEGVAATPIEVRVTQDNDIVTIIAGPILGALEQFVPDSTEVKFTLTDDEGNQREFLRVSELGYSELSLRKWTLDVTLYQVNVTAGDGAGQILFRPQ